MDFPGQKTDIKTSVSKNFFDSVLNLIFVDVVLHNSHIDGKIFGYAHNFCNQRVKENRSPISVIAHNLFKCDFFFVLKEIRLSVWRTKNKSIGGKNLTGVQYANISDQVKFIDTVKYYQQSLAKLSQNCDKVERENIRKSTIHFLENHPKYLQRFDSLNKNERHWVVDYLCSGKGVIPYESIKSWSDLDYIPKNNFFSKGEFFSSLKNSTISAEEYGNVKTFWDVLGMQKLSDLNDI